PPSTFLCTTPAPTAPHTLSLHDALPISGIPQRPGADLDDQPGLFGDRDELARTDQPVLGIAPADQGFRAFYPIRQHVHLRLIEQDRKSTRLNSSHLGISYAVSCLKKNTM